MDITWNDTPTIYLDFIKYFYLPEIEIVKVDIAFTDEMEFMDQEVKKSLMLQHLSICKKMKLKYILYDVSKGTSVNPPDVQQFFAERVSVELDKMGIVRTAVITSFDLPSIVSNEQLVAEKNKITSYDTKIFMNERDAVAWLLNG